MIEAERLHVTYMLAADHLEASLLKARLSDADRRSRMIPRTEFADGNHCLSCLECGPKAREAWHGL